MKPVELTTTDAVIDFLGEAEIRRITGRGRTAPSNWRQHIRGKFPPETFLVIQFALKKRGAIAPPSLWGMNTPVEKLLV